MRGSLRDEAGLANPRLAADDHPGPSPARSVLPALVQLLQGILSAHEPGERARGGRGSTPAPPRQGAPRCDGGRAAPPRQTGPLTTGGPSPGLGGPGERVGTAWGRGQLGREARGPLEVGDAQRGPVLFGEQVAREGIQEPVPGILCPAHFLEGGEPRPVNPLQGSMLPQKPRNRLSKMGLPAVAEEDLFRFAKEIIEDLPVCSLACRTSPGSRCATT
jgi:hypothetical protein